MLLRASYLHQNDGHGLGWRHQVVADVRGEQAMLLKPPQLLLCREGFPRECSARSSPAFLPCTWRMPPPAGPWRSAQRVAAAACHQRPGRLRLRPNDLDLQQGSLQLLRRWLWSRARRWWCCQRPARAPGCQHRAHSSAVSTFVTTLASILVKRIYWTTGLEYDSICKKNGNAHGGGWLYVPLV
jgi:hypothetical protein